MEQIEQTQTLSHELQKPQEIAAPNESLWKTFYNKFSPEEKKHFLRNQIHFLSRIIQKEMRKAKERARKLRENYR